MIHQRFPQFYIPLLTQKLTSFHQPHNYLLIHFNTFTFGNESTPHPLAFLQMACDGVSPLRLDEALLTNH